jgi:uncharacterized protein YlxW (UPF0749 family)
VTVGAAQARVTAPREARERQELIHRITQDTAAADRLESGVDALRTEVRARQRAALKDGGRGQASLVELLSGASAVHGPGVQLMVDDATSADQNGGDGGPRESAGFSDTGRVRDHDMQRVVNGLWASGAEAVSINGQRLTALSAIRAAGDAILVDNRPLVPPYTVLAVGDGQRLSTRFQNGADGLYLHALQDDFGIRTSISVRDDLRLPPAPSVIVRTAQPAVPAPRSTRAAHRTQAAQSTPHTQKGTS